MKRWSQWEVGKVLPAARALALLSASGGGLGLANVEFGGKIKEP